VLSGVPAARLTSEVERVIDALAITEHRRKRLRALSKGNFQRVGLAQALFLDAQVVIFDEPTHGLDPVWTQKFRDLIAELRHPTRTILIASHNLDELERVADRVAILDGGRLQRVVTVRTTGGSAGGPAVYRLALADGMDAARAAFPDGVLDHAGELQVHVADLTALNRGLADAISRGAVFSGVVPTQSALERQFREAVRGGNA
jgi:ABC-2 type transport system ATP-binding protein